MKIFARLFIRPKADFCICICILQIKLDYNFYDHFHLQQSWLAKCCCKCAINFTSVKIPFFCENDFTKLFSTGIDKSYINDRIKILRIRKLINGSFICANKGRADVVKVEV